MVFEHYRVPLAPRQVFFRRLQKSGVIAFCILAGSLAMGTVGYHLTEGWSWLDSALNAAMILGGMGPVDKVETSAGKVFAICYALYSGVAFLATMAVFFAPVIHRFLHHLHLTPGSEKA